MGLSIPVSIVAGFAPTDTCSSARAWRRPVRGHGLPDDARAHHRPLVGAGPDEVDRAVVGARRRLRRARAARRGRVLLEHFDWGSVFLVTLPLAVVALVMAVVLVPGHVNESTEPVDNLGGILSAVLVGAWSSRSTSSPVPGETTSRSGCSSIAVVAASCSSCAAARGRTRSTTSGSRRGRPSGSPRSPGSSSSAR